MASDGDRPRVVRQDIPVKRTSRDVKLVRPELSFRHSISTSMVRVSANLPMLSQTRDAQDGAQWRATERAADTAGGVQHQLTPSTPSPRTSQSSSPPPPRIYNKGADRAASAAAAALASSSRAHSLLSRGRSIAEGSRSSPPFRDGRSSKEAQRRSPFSLGGRSSSSSLGMHRGWHVRNDDDLRAMSPDVLNDKYGCTPSKEPSLVDDGSYDDIGTTTTSSSPHGPTVTSLVADALKRCDRKQDPTRSKMEEIVSRNYALPRHTHVSSAGPSRERKRDPDEESLSSDDGSRFHTHVPTTVRRKQAKQKSARMTNLNQFGDPLSSLSATSSPNAQRTTSPLDPIDVDAADDSTTVNTPEKFRTAPGISVVVASPKGARRRQNLRDVDDDIEEDDANATDNEPLVSAGSTKSSGNGSGSRSSMSSARTGEDAGEAHRRKRLDVASDTEGSGVTSSSADNFLPPVPHLASHPGVEGRLYVGRTLMSRLHRIVYYSSEKSYIQSTKELHLVVELDNGGIANVVTLKPDVIGELLYMEQPLPVLFIYPETNPFANEHYIRAYFNNYDGHWADKLHRYIMLLCRDARSLSNFITKLSRTSIASKLRTITSKSELYEHAQKAFANVSRPKSPVAPSAPKAGILETLNKRKSISTGTTSPHFAAPSSASAHSSNPHVRVSKTYKGITQNLSKSKEISSVLPKRLTRQSKDMFRYDDSDGDDDPTLQRVLKQSKEDIIVRRTEKKPEGYNFANPHETILVYSCGRTSITITWADVDRLEENEFLNDTILEFWLRYCLQERLPSRKDDFFIFSTYFYSQLVQNPKGQHLTPTQRYETVKKWTAKKSIFDKRFIIVPINENSHWYLAIIYNPGAVIDKSWPVDFPIPRLPELDAAEAAVVEMNSPSANSPASSPAATANKNIEREAFSKTSNKPNEMMTSADSYRQDASGALQSASPTKKAKSPTVVREKTKTEASYHPLEYFFHEDVSSLAAKSEGAAQDDGSVEAAIVSEPAPSRPDHASTQRKRLPLRLVDSAEECDDDEHANTADDGSGPIIEYSEGVAGWDAGDKAPLERRGGGNDEDKVVILDKSSHAEKRRPKLPELLPSPKRPRSSSSDVKAEDAAVPVIGGSTSTQSIQLDDEGDMIMKDAPKHKSAEPARSPALMNTRVDAEGDVVMAGACGTGATKNGCRSTSPSRSPTLSPERSIDNAVTIISSSEPSPSRNLKRDASEKAAEPSGKETGGASPRGRSVTPSSSTKPMPPPKEIPVHEMHRHSRSSGGDKRTSSGGSGINVSSFYGKNSAALFGAPVRAFHEQPAADTIDIDGADDISDSPTLMNASKRLSKPSDADRRRLLALARKEEEKRKKMERQQRDALRRMQERQDRLDESRETARHCFIFTFDSLGGRKVSAVKNLRQYLVLEALDKESYTVQGDPREKILGVHVKVPNQPNFCDCGLFLLETVETLMRKTDELLPLLVTKLAKPSDWYKADDVTNKKRDEIRKVILDKSKEFLAANPSLSTAGGSGSGASGKTAEESDDDDVVILG